MDRGIEQDALPLPGEPHAQFDVFDRGVREAFLVKPLERHKIGASNRAETRPERRRRTCGPVVNVMMKKVSEVRDEAVRAGIVIVRAEDGREVVVGLESATDPDEGIRVNLDVRVD